MSNPNRASSPARIQYAALPFRRRESAGTEVLLVTSRRTGRWIIPKGWPIKRKPPHAAAAQEALEEAGVVGEVRRRPIGSYQYEKRLKTGQAIVCKVQVFPLEVKQQEKTWPEKGKRQVKWFSPEDAASRVDDGVLRDLIRKLPS
ncbi:MAG: NUDIX hydrolase [Xanthobacteraceae bacterium]